MVSLPQMGPVGPSKSMGHPLFPRASERRVLPIVGVCQTSSHLHISSSHPLIFTSHLHILSSSHLLIFTSSHLHTFPSSHLLIFLIYLEEETPYAWSRHMNRFNMSFNMWFNSKAHFVQQIQYVIFCRQGKGGLDSPAPGTVPFICSWHIGALARAGGLCRKSVIRPASLINHGWWILVDTGGYWWHVSAI